MTGVRKAGRTWTQLPSISRIWAAARTPLPREWPQDDEPYPAGLCSRRTPWRPLEWSTDAPGGPHHDGGQGPGLYLHRGHRLRLLHAHRAQGHRPDAGPVRAEPGRALRLPPAGGRRREADPEG